MPQYFLAPLAALAFVMAFEGTSAAKTQAGAVLAIQEVSHFTSPATSPTPAAPASAQTPATSTLAADRDFANSVIAAHVRICHISRHPRDGVPAEVHACPLLIAEASPAIATPAAVRAD
jgi:hypothetical protein